MTPTDFTLLLKKIGIGVLLVLIPLGILAGALHLTHRLLVRQAASQPDSSNLK